MQTTNNNNNQQTTNKRKAMVQDLPGQPTSDLKKRKVFLEEQQWTVYTPEEIQHFPSDNEESDSDDDVSDTSSSSSMDYAYDDLSLGEELELSLYNITEPYEQEETELTLSKIPEYLWIHIYEYIGYEHMFYNRIFKINRTVWNNIINNQLFWEAVFSSLCKGNLSEFTDLSLYQMRYYCICKLMSFERQKSLNLSVLYGWFKDGEWTPTIISHPIENHPSNSCFVVKVEDQSYHFKRESTTVEAGIVCASNVRWKMQTFLDSIPYLFLLTICTGINQNRSAYMAVEVDGKKIRILGPETIVHLQIKKVFRKLELDPEILEQYTILSPRFEKMDFGSELMKDKYFIWFCNEILQPVQFPIEEVLEEFEFSTDPDFYTVVESDDDNETY